MEIPKLTYFLAAAQTNNFRRAAELCSVAQPVLSRQIAALEVDLGVELFKRTHKRVHLTEAGREFAVYAQHALETLHQGQQAMTELHEGERGLVRMGCIEGFAFDRLPEIFTRFYQRYPHIRLQICIRGTDELLQLVEQGQLDFVVVGMTFDRGKPPETLMVQEIFRDRLHVLVAPHHPLAQLKGSHILLEQVAREPLFLLSEGFGARRVIERVYEQHGFPVQPVVEVDLIEGLKALIKLGIGVTFLPPSMTRSSLSAELVALPVADLNEEFVFGLVQRRFDVLSSAAKVAMKTFLQDLRPQAS
ncbi:LysR family transcriptional regulator [Ktedonobacter sp. SOSP1-52]|uniref:LysR family transcriptional regulator n=1 Tax=Ktedonobacter sp. SOSP1-52 TaxID=2778366 RepID=UPI001915E4E4|nr:LysR family transcriptional regulator [Ktedonobacter sp. SOSP1-52]